LCCAAASLPQVSENTLVPAIKLQHLFLVPGGAAAVLGRTFLKLVVLCRSFAAALVLGFLLVPQFGCCTCSHYVGGASLVPAALLLHLFSVGACITAALPVLGFVPTVKLHCRACWWVRSMCFHACSILQACHPSHHVLCTFH
jgi:hypothetical protein